MMIQGMIQDTHHLTLAISNPSANRWVSSIFAGSNSRRSGTAGSVPVGLRLDRSCLAAPEGFLENHTGDIRAGIGAHFAYLVQVAIIPFADDVVGVAAIVGFRGGKQRVTPVNIDLLSFRAGPFQFDRVVAGSFRCQSGGWRRWGLR